jgi:hypothetical protein
MSGSGGKQRIVIYRSKAAPLEAILRAGGQIDAAIAVIDAVQGTLASRKGCA